MLHKMFTVYDSAAEAYLQPFFLPTNGLAIRTFTDTVNDPSHRFAQHPADYTLFEIGLWDDMHCTWDLLETPNSLGTGLEFQSQAEPAPSLLKQMES